MQRISGLFGVPALIGIDLWFFDPARVDLPVSYLHLLILELPSRGMQRGTTSRAFNNTVPHWRKCDKA